MVTKLLLSDTETSEIFSALKFTTHFFANLTVSCCFNFASILGCFAKVYWLANFENSHMF